MSEKIVYENDQFKLVVTDDALGEDTNYGREGYAAVNKATGVTEWTGMVQTQGIFFCSQCAGILRSVAAGESPESTLVEQSSEDVVLQ